MSLARIQSKDAGGRAQGVASEREVFEFVYRRMRALVGHSASDLDDLVQAAAERVFRSLDSFDGRCQFSTWVFAICYRTLTNHRRWYRRWSSRFSLKAEFDEQIGAEPSPIALLEARERAFALRKALARLSDKYRTVVVLHDLEGLKVDEIAAIVSANERTVRSRLRDGRKQLSRQLDEDEHATEETER